MSRIRVRIKGGHKAKVNIKNAQPVQVKTDTTYLYDPTIIDKEVQQAKDWAIKTDGLVEEEGVGVDYSAKAYAIGGTGTTTNNAKYYAEQAGLSATSASDSATIATTQAGIATTQAGIATTQAGTATTQAGIATNKASEASDSAATATTQAGIATTQAGIATTKAVEASTSATNAHTSELNASLSETNAAASELSASQSATTASTRAGEASTSATNANNSALSAATSESNALTYSQNAASSEYNASISESNAHDSELAAATSESNAYGYSLTAIQKATDASNSATEASGYATSASTSETNAGVSATNAQTWAEGSDAQVSVLGGEKSSKGWCQRAKELVDSIGTVLHYKGSVATYDDLPTTGREVGDMYNVIDTGNNYVWEGTGWDEISGIVDLSPYRKASDQDTIDAGKVDKVTTASKVYGTDTSGNQTTYDKDSFGQVDDVQVNGTSVVTNKVASVTVPTQPSDIGAQPAGNYMTTDTAQSVGAGATKTFNGRVNFIGTGDAKAIYLSTDTRIDVYGTSRTVLGFASGTFLINNSAYPLNLRGGGARPAWNGTSYLALTSDIGNATLTIQKNGTAVDTFTANATSDKTINITVPTNNNELTNGAGYQTSSDVASAISVETTNRENADIGLQQQIDAITASSDVKDIVGTYAQLQAYDTSTLGNNDIIKVLQDETHDNETTYYRWSTTTETFTLIGEEGPYYTKSESDSTFVPQTRTVNNKDLSSNITLTASDVGALPDSTVIPTVNNATLTIQKNGTSVATFTANSSTNATANITVPTDTGDLTNGAGFITGITSSDVTTALGYTPYDDSNPDGYITGITSGDVTTALGYTPYNSTNPSGYQANVIETVKVNGTALTPSSKAVDITVPTNNNQLTNGAGYITSSALTGYATETWVGQQGFLTSTALNGYATESWVGQQGYITGITSAMVTTALGYSPVNPTSLASVATSGSYNDLSNKPTIPTVNNPTITITQGGVTKGSFTLNQSTGDTIALDAGGGGSVNTFNLFDHKWSDYQLNDQSWLRADTFSWQDGTVYSDVYDHLVDDIDGKTATSETVGSYTISYYLADDGHKITTDESTVADIYAESGVAWYYVLDTANTRFKLPRENPAREELIQVIRAKGNGMSLGLTDGTTNKALVGFNNAPYTSFNAVTNGFGQPVGSSYTADGVSSGKTYGITTDPTKSGIISSMTDSTSVYKGKKYLYFYVGQFSQSATEQTAGLNAELFNGKVDLDLNNMNPSASAKQTIVGWGIPDYSAGISLNGISSPYTAPKDGVVILERNIGTVYVNGNYVATSGQTYSAYSVFIPVSSGDIVSWTQGTPYNGVFYPLKGV